MKFRDASVPIMFVAIVLTFILPIPAALLDFLLAINVMVAGIILLNTVYLKEPLEISIFPSLIVITLAFLFVRLLRRLA